MAGYELYTGTQNKLIKSITCKNHQIKTFCNNAHVFIPLSTTKFLIPKGRNCQKFLTLHMYRDLV